MLIKEPIIVAFASDDRYAPYIGIAIQTICENVAKKIHIVILEDKISSVHKSMIEKMVNLFFNVTLQWIPVDAEKLFADGVLIRDITLSTYSRFLLPSFFPNERRVLYLDCDVVILKDISLLFEGKDFEETIAAVTTIPSDGGADVQKRLNLSNKHEYFNSGVLMINCQRWEKDGTYEKLMTLEKEYHDRLVFGDQDLLNKCFDANYMKLSPVYNATNNEITEELHKKAVIRHFEGGVKPWKQHPLKIWAKRYKAKYKGLWEFWKVAIRSPFKDELFAKYPLERWIIEKFIV